MTDHPWGNQPEPDRSEAEVLRQRVAELELRCAELTAQRDLARRTLDEAGGRWIPVGERRPELKSRGCAIEVLVWTGVDQYLAAYYPSSDYWETETWDSGAAQLPNSAVRAWRPLPDPPEGE